MKCSCGSTNIHFSPSEGNLICLDCGLLLEESRIVNEITFQTTSSGGAAVVGTMVREITVTSGEKRVKELGQTLGLKDHEIEYAIRIYRIARVKNFTYGRKRDYVAAACIYFACRKGKKAYMLIDIADLINAKVYKLGNTFVRLCSILDVTEPLPLADPSLYIDRFASMLEFGDKDHAVAQTALRLIQKMNRDWLQTGRRPSGICGAALLMAARLHGFNRVPSDIVNIVRIGDSTLRNRIIEFLSTPAAQMTAKELESEEPDTSKKDLSSSMDPPVMIQRRKREEKLKIKQESPDQDEKKKKRFLEDDTFEKRKKPRISNDFSSVSTLVEELEEEKGESEPLTQLEEVTTEMNAAIQELERMQNNLIQQDTEFEAETEGSLTVKTTTTPPTEIYDPNLPLVVDDQPAHLDGINAIQYDSIFTADGNDTFSDVDDSELEAYINDETTVNSKSVIWHFFNKDFLIEKARKEEEKKNQNEKQKTKRPRKKKADVNTAGEAVEAALTTRSKKLNWDVDMNALFKEIQEDFSTEGTRGEKQQQQELLAFSEPQNDILDLPDNNYDKQSEVLKDWI